MVQIKIKDNNRNREVAFIKTVPQTFSDCLLLGSRSRRFF